MNQRLISETAFLMAKALLGLVQGGLPAEDPRMAFEFLFDTCKDGLELYETERERMERRLHPLGK